MYTEGNKTALQFIFLRFCFSGNTQSLKGGNASFFICFKRKIKRPHPHSNKTKQTGEDEHQEQTTGETKYTGGGVHGQEVLQTRSRRTTPPGI